MPLAAEPDWPPERIAAGVVLYYPEVEAFATIDTLARQFDRVFVVENESAEYPAMNPAVEVIYNTDNRGLAAADNQLCAAARTAEFEWLLLFDQDSLIPADFRQSFEQCFHALEHPPALLAANYCTELLGERFPGYRFAGEDEVADLVVALHSGSLINLAVHAAVDGHDESFFVDHVDHEYCLRLRRRGYRVQATRPALFRHEVGQVACARLFGRVWQSGGHSPARRREATEALVRLIKSYWRDEPGWCMRMLIFELPRSVVAMLVLERMRVAKLTAVTAGLVRGIFRSKLSVS
jgi:rhamnosyltransferase